MLDPNLEDIAWEWKTKIPHPCPVCGVEHERLTTCMEEFGFELKRCPECTHVAVNPQPSPEELGEFYDKYFPPESSEMWSEQMTNVFSKEGRDYFRKQGISPGRALDVGCGYGFYLKILKEDGWDVSGVEPSVVAAGHAKDELKLDVKRGILEEGMFPEESFDHVSLWYVLEHVPAPTEVIQLCTKLLKPGGIIIVRIPNNNVSVDRKLSMMGSFGSRFFLINPPRHLQDFNTTSVRQLLQKCNLDELAITNGVPRSTGTLPQLIRRHTWYAKSRLLTLLSGNRLITGSTMTIYARKPT